MGNQLAQPQRLQPEHIAEIPNVVLKENLGGGRFLKTLLCVHDEGGQVVVKVYSKRGDVDLEPYEQHLVKIRKRLAGLPCSHVWPLQRFFHTEKAAYLIRQHIFSNLYHRLSTRPFLASIEKRWVAFQLLHALAQSHEQGICHGDIKCENVLVTSWHWVYLADYASYKPTRLPADNPADFSFFFDTGGRRRCYIAPERFYESGEADVATLADAPLEPAMDVFSMGCVIAELFLEGKRLFDLSELLAYRRGEYDPTATLSKIEQPFRDLARHMISRNPDERLPAGEYLRQWGASLFPPYFERLLHPFFCALLPLDADARVAAVQRDFHTLLQGIHGPGAGANGVLPAPKLHVTESPSAELGEASSVPGADNMHDNLSDSLSEPASSEPSTSGRQEVCRVLADTAELLRTLGDKGLRRREADRLALPPDGGNGHVGGRESPGESGRGKEGSAVVEEVFEFQCRDRARAFGEASSSGRTIALREWKPPPTRRKEDIPLPADSTWHWAEDWQVAKLPGSDGAGWSYRSKQADGEFQWVAKCKTDCLWRRRKWTRQRRRTAQPPSGLSQDGARIQAGKEAGPNDTQGMVIIATLLCSSMRGAQLQESKARAIALLSEAARYCDDDTRLQRIVPYLVECMKVPMASVRCAALQSLARVLSLIESLPPSDAKVFAEYILPSLSLVPNDREEWMRVCYASAIGPLAAAAHRFLMRLQSLAATSQALVRYEAEMQELRMAVEKVVHEVVMGSRSTTATRRALLPHLATLALLLGRKETNDFLLPVVITFLNSPDWQLRAAFFEHVGCVGSVAGPISIQAFLFPCLPQALADRQEAVIAEALGFLTKVTRAGHLNKRALLTAAVKVLPRQPGQNKATMSGKASGGGEETLSCLKLVLPHLLHHRSASVRAKAAEFAAAAALRLSPAEAYIHLRPLLLPALASDPVNFSDVRKIVAALPQRSVQPSGGAVEDSHKGKGGKGMENGGSRQKEEPPLVLQPVAPLYSVKVDVEALKTSKSMLKAALMGVSSDAERHFLKPGGVGADVLLARARRLNKATAEMASVHGRLAPSLQLATEEALSFQVDTLRTPPQSVASSVHNAMDAAIHTSLPTYSPAPANPGLPWRPRGVLVAHLAEHKKAVNQIAVAANGAFFATASSDETVKIWDCRRLEKDVTFRSRLTYASQAGRILTCAACDDSQSLATGSSNGSLHVWRVEYTTRPGGHPDRYTGTVGKRQTSVGEGAVLSVMQWDGLLLYSTRRGGLHAWDLRSNRDAFHLTAPSSQGYWEKVVADQEGASWLVTGSTRGHIALWDMRFQVCVNSWQHPLKAPIQAMAQAAASPRRLGLPRLGATCPLLYVSAGPSEIGLWDVEHSRCHQVLQVLAHRGGAGHIQLPSPAANISPLVPVGGTRADALTRQLAVEDVHKHAAATPQGCRTMLPTAAGALLTGSSDGCIRCWDAARPEQSYQVCGPPRSLDSPAPETGAPIAGVTYGQRLAGGVHIVEELPMMQATEVPGQAARAEQRRAAVSHADGVTHLEGLHTGERVLLSAGADGVVKAWK